MAKDTKLKKIVGHVPNKLITLLKKDIESKKTCNDKISIVSTIDYKFDDDDIKFFYV